MGLYYSYYKSMVDAPTWWDGFMELVEDKVTEHPKTRYNHDIYSFINFSLKNHFKMVNLSLIPYKITHNIFVEN